MAKLSSATLRRRLVRNLCWSGFFAVGCAKIVGLETPAHPYSTSDELGGIPGSNAGGGGAGDGGAAGGDNTVAGSAGLGGSAGEPQVVMGGDAGNGGVASSVGCGSCPNGTTCTPRVLGDRAAGFELTCEPQSCSNETTDAGETKLNCGSDTSNCGRCDQAPMRVLRGTLDLPVMLYRRSTGLWALADLKGTTPEVRTVFQAGDVPLLGDFDADQRLDLATYRSSDRTWSVLTFDNSKPAMMKFKQLPPVIHDAPDGDYIALTARFFTSGGDNHVLWNRQTGEWRVYGPAGKGTVLTAHEFGEPGDQPVPGDYDGADGRDEYAVYRNGRWLTRTVGLVDAELQALGSAGDQPIPCNYDANATLDLGTFNPQTRDWKAMDAKSGAKLADCHLDFPGTAALPITGDFNADGSCDLALWDPESGRVNAWDTKCDPLGSRTWKLP